MAPFWVESKQHTCWRASASSQYGLKVEVSYRNWQVEQNRKRRNCLWPDLFWTVLQWWNIWNSLSTVENDVDPKLFCTWLTALDTCSRSLSLLVSLFIALSMLIWASTCLDSYGDTALPLIMQWCLWFLSLLHLKCLCTLLIQLGSRIGDVWTTRRFQNKREESKKWYDSSRRDDAIVGWKHYGVILLEK